MVNAMYSEMNAIHAVPSVSILSDLAGVTERAHQLGAMVENLEKKISPISSSRPQPGSLAGGPPKAQRSDVGERIRSLDEALARLCSQVDRIISEIEL